MMKRLFSLLLTLAILLGAMPGLAETAVPVLRSADIASLKALAGDAQTGATWHEGMSPSASMNALQMWQWTDWFLSEKLRSLLGSAQDYIQLASGLPDSSLSTLEWELRALEDQLTYYEEQLSDGRTAILNGIRLYQDVSTSAYDRARAYDRMMEAKDEIRQAIQTISANYADYTALVARCNESMLAAPINHSMLTVQGSSGPDLMKEAKRLENSENAADAIDFDVTVISTKQICIAVYDSDKNPLSGALVHLVNNKDSKRTKDVVTGSDGRAVFWVSDLGADEKTDMKLGLRVTANGYQTHEIQTVKIRGGESVSVHLKKDDQTPYLVMACFNGRDILNEESSFYYSKKNNLKHTFSVKLSCAGSGELEMRYPTDAAGTAFQSVKQTFTAADSDKKVFTFEKEWLRILHPESKVSFKLTTNGQEYTFDTHLKIEKAVVDEPFFDHSALFSFTSGSGGFGFTIPGDVPFISGSTLSLSIPGNYPTLMILPSGMGMFSWGYDFAPESTTWKTDDTQDQERAIKEFDKQSAADKLLAAAGVYRNVNTTTTPKLLGDYGVHITPFAAMQGLYRRSDQSLELRGNGGATFAFEAGFTQTFTIGPVPFFAGIDFSMGASFGVGISLNMKAEIENGLLKVKEGPVIGYDSGMTISFRLELGGTIGLGLKDVLSVSLRGYGYINPIIHLTTPQVSAEARIGIGLSVTLRALFLKWSTTLWEGNLPLSSSDSIVLTASGESTASSSWRDNNGAEDPLPAAANGVVKAVGASGVEPTTTQKLFDRIDCSAGDFQYVVVDGDTYLFWIQPGSGYTNWERVNWYNLNDPTKHGQVGWIDSGISPKRDNTKAKYQDWFVDYDFTVEPSRDIQGNSSHFCALTILSGRFAKPTSEDEVNPPQEACAASVLMQKQKDGSLEVVYYREETGNFTPYSYPTMPEVFLTATEKLSSVFMVNTYVRSDETKVSGLVVSGNDNVANFSCTALRSSLFENGKEIARYHVGEPTAVSAGAPEEDKMNFYVLSVLGTNSVLARIRNSKQQVLAKGDIVNFKVVTRINGVNDKDTLFYLDRVKTDEGGFIHRLKGVTLSPQSPEKPVTVTDYDIEVNADRFDTVKFGGGIYLYWTECSTPNTNVVPDAKAEYLVRCVRYDPDTDTICDPFTLVQLGESPSSVKLQDSGTGFYAVDLGNKNGSYVRQSLTKFTYQLVMSAELQAAVPNDPCVCAGDYIDLILSVRNTGNLPLSGLNVAVKKGSQVIQTLHIDCTQPQESTNLFFAANGNLAAEQKGVYTIRRVDGMYDALNGESWNITSTNSNGVTTQRNVRTTLLMPGDTQSYKAKLLIPADWDGKVDLTAEIIQTVGVKQFGALLTENGRPLSNALVLTTDATNDDPVLMRLTPKNAHKIVDTDSHDLMLSAQLFNREGETYVRVSILNRSGNTKPRSRVVPTLTSSYNGQTLFSHTFRNAMEDDYGYSMDIPLQTLTAGRRLDELDLNVSSKENYEEFADADNHVRLSLFPKLYIAQQPESLNLVEKQDALFVVSADGGQRPYRYQWQKLNAEGRWVDLPGANQNSYQLPKVTLAQSGLTLRCVVTDEAGDSVTSDSAVLSVFSLPQTGDETQPALWMLLAVASAALIALLCFRRRKDD
ncbi:MAG: LPXTG cell wall anchor domain-containing protein [Christensenellales bacterium]|nr:LPXTG cell wall anchor domain-containing protein [Christensenellales bacterium]